MKNRNPWLGLATYDEQSIREGYKFCGREQATKELYSIVDNNICTTLYGKSGIGKSSLLQAGLFPRLRTASYFPVMIRLGIGETKQAYSTTIISAIKSAIEEAGGSHTTIADGSGTAEEQLKSFFRTTEFRDSNDEIIFPIIVLDQFEELYFRDRAPLNTLLKAIYLLVDDNATDANGEEEIINYRIVISIREDDLFHLEESIDKLRLTEMKSNRYRLRELSDEEARNVIIQPAGTLLAPDEREQIAATIINEAKAGSEEISTAILSLICSRIYDSTTDKAAITQQQVTAFFKAAEGNFLKSFYDDIIKELHSPAKWYYIEDALVTDEGRRNSVPKSEFERRIPDATFLFHGEKSMLRYVTLPGNDEPRVEIIHDTLARQMLSSKTERKLQQQAAALRRQRLTAIAIIAVIVAIGAAFFMQYRSIVNERNNMYKMQSRFIAEKAEKLIEKGDNTTAIRLLLNVMPKNLGSPDRPYIEEAEFALRKAHGLGCNFKNILKHNYIVNSASFSPDGKYIVTASDDYTAKIWDIETGEQTGETMRHYSVVYTASFSPDGRFIVTASRDKTARIWNAKTGEQVGEIMKHDYDVNSASFSPDGKYIVTASYDHTAKIWDAKTGELVGETMKDYDGVNSASFSPDGKYILTTSWNNTAKIWNLETGEQVGEIMKHDDEVNSASFSPDGKYILTASGDNTAKIWYVQTGEQEGMTMKHNGGVNSASFSPDGKYIVTASYDHTAKIWNAQTGEQVGMTMKHNNTVYSASFSPDGKYIVTASYDHTTKIWNAKTGEQIRESTIQNKSIKSALFSPDGKHIVTVSSYNNNAIIWDIQTEVKIKENNIVDTLDYDIPNLFNTKELKKVVKNPVITWNTQVKMRMKHNGNVNSVSFSPDGKYIVTASDDNTAKIWNAETKIQVGMTMKHDDDVNSASFSPDGKYILTASGDNTVKIWYAKTGIQVGITMKHDKTIRSASFSNDGKYIFIVLYDKSAKIWNAKTCKQVGDITKHDFLAKPTSFSNDGKYIITSLSNNTVKITERISSQELLDRYNKLFEDWPLTEEELREYNFK